MRINRRAIILTVAVAALGVVVVYQYLPTSKAPSKRLARKAVASAQTEPVSAVRGETLPTEGETVPPSSTTPAVEQQPPAPLNPPADAPPPLDIPDRTSELKPEQRTTEPDPRQVAGYFGEIFVRLDSDHDDRLVRLEIPEFCREQLMARDANNDGKIDVKEFVAAIPVLPEPPAARSTVAASALVNPPEAGQEIPVYQPRSTKRTDEVPLWFLQLDSNKDNHIAVYEWPRTEDRNKFRALDENDDGFITLQEARKAERQETATERRAADPDADRVSAP